MDSGSSSDDEEDGGEGESQPPVLQLHKVAHEGGVNRIRAMAQNPHICVSWADTGHVQIWDLDRSKCSQKVKRSQAREDLLYFRVLH
ncbi:hypothetical protein Sjap_026551 [Stephania japonica]|uniref:Uncharacterized protein n=1 Tax=Stephania japonica TaxID=461633 RepID=A0AAP0E3R6_9MAGN